MITARTLGRGVLIWAALMSMRRRVSTWGNILMALRRWNGAKAFGLLKIIGVSKPSFASHYIRSMNNPVNVAEADNFPSIV